MKRLSNVFLLLLAVVFSLAGCGPEAQLPEEQPLGIINPWTDHAALAEAEAAVGFSLGLPETVADYQAQSFRTMNGRLLEVLYCSDTGSICVRKQAGEGQDISGDYTLYEYQEESEEQGATLTLLYNADNRCKQLISFRGYSWSLVAEAGFSGDSNRDFLNLILE